MPGYAPPYGAGVVLTAPPAGINGLHEPTARAVTLFVDGVPNPPAWAVEFDPGICALRTNPCPDRIARLTQLIECDEGLSPRSREAGRMLIDYYSSCGLAFSTCHLVLMIVIFLVSPGLILLGWYVTWPAFVVGIAGLIYPFFGIYQKCSQRSKANELMPRILATVQIARRELNLPPLPENAPT